jgi:hypothetical protein
VSRDVTIEVSASGARSYVLALVESTDQWQKIYYLTGDVLDWSCLDWQTRSFLAGAARHILERLATDPIPAAPRPRPNGT